MKVEKSKYVILCFKGAIRTAPIRRLVLACSRFSVVGDGEKGRAKEKK